MITINQTSKILFLGGGPTMRNVISEVQSDGFSISVVTSLRHAQALESGSTFEDFLKLRGVPVLVTSTLNYEDLIEFCPDIEERIAISIGAPWVIRPDLIGTYFSSKLLNLHGTGLPKNRGGGGFSWQILTRNRFGFSTLQIIDSGIDTGPIVASEEFLYSGNCRIPIEYETQYIQKSTEFLCNFLRKTRGESLHIKSVNQAEELSTYWPRLLTDENGWIDWSLRVHELENFICAFDDPYLGGLNYSEQCESPPEKSFKQFSRRWISSISIRPSL
jgi:methionyl-tRNA formyltransferase